jgi:hypothetical protein
MVLEHQGEHSSPYAAIRSIAAKIGCSVSGVLPPPSSERPDPAL